MSYKVIQKVNQRDFVTTSSNIDRFSLNKFKDIMVKDANTPEIFLYRTSYRMDVRTQA